MTFGSDVTLSWNQITDTDNVADKNDIPTDISQLNDAYGQKWSTTIGNNWIKTSTVTAQNLNVQNLNTTNSSGFVKAKTDNQYAALEVACSGDGAGIRIYNGTKNGNIWNPTYGTYSQISSKAITFYDGYTKGVKLSNNAGLDLNNHSINNCTAINLITNDTPTSDSTNENTAPSYKACANMIDNIKDLIPSSSDFISSRSRISTTNTYTGRGVLSSSSYSSTAFVVSLSGGDSALELKYTNMQLKTSDARTKIDISDIPDYTNVYMKFRPKKYRFDKRLNGYDEQYHYNLIAQDVEKALIEEGIKIEETGLVWKQPCNKDFNEEEVIGDTEIYKLNTDELHALHIQMIQKQEHEIEELKQEIEKLKETIKK